MQEFVRKVLRNFSDFYGTLSPPRRIGMILLGSFIIITLVSIITWAVQTRYATLYAALLREINAKGSDARFKKAERGKFEAA